MLSFAENPKPMPEALTDSICSRCNNVGKQVPLKKFEAGHSGEIHSGAFSNFITTVEQMANDARAWVLVDFMGKTTRVQVDRQQVQALWPTARRCVQVGVDLPTFKKSQRPQEPEYGGTL